MGQLRQLGTNLRDRHSSTFWPEGRPAAGQLEVVSTRTARTINSARALVQGLVPEMTKEEAEAVVQHGPQEAETMIGQMKQCDKLRLLCGDAREHVEEEPLLLRTWMRLALEAPEAAAEVTSLVKA